MNILVEPGRAVSGERKYGDVKAAAEELGFESQSLMDAKWVAGSVETSRRREVLSFSHHREVAPLDPAEQDRWLARAEREAWSTRDGRLYRDSHGTFEAYCRERWGFTDRRARQLMDAAEIGTIVPVANEAQARELMPLARADEDAARAVWAALREAHGDTVHSC